MVNISFGWIATNSYQSEKNVPTLWIGKRNVELESDNSLELIFLEGYEKLDKEYVDSLIEVGYTIIDAEGIYSEMKKKFSKLNRFSEYERRCFLRWLVLKDIYGDSNIIHYDGDVVFNEIPENLERKLGKYTFVLQGCPAFVSIRDPTWLELYGKNLHQFCDNIDKYSADAWNLRDGYEYSWKHKWAGARYREIISSDQDLISHLIHADILPQDPPETIKMSNPDLILFENPLYLFSHNPEIGNAAYHRKGLVDYFGNQKVAFWHMQNDFADYLKMIYFWKDKLKYPFRIPNRLEIDKASAVNKFKIKLINYASIPIAKKLDRWSICRYFFEESNFSKVFNKKNFWYWL